MTCAWARVASEDGMVKHRWPCTECCFPIYVRNICAFQITDWFEEGFCSFFAHLVLWFQFTAQGGLGGNPDKLIRAGCKHPRFLRVDRLIDQPPFSRFAPERLGSPKAFHAGRSPKWKSTMRAARASPERLGSPKAFHAGRSPRWKSTMRAARARGKLALLRKAKPSKAKPTKARQVRGAVRSSAASSDFVRVMDSSRQGSTTCRWHWACDVYRRRVA